MQLLDLEFGPLMLDKQALLDLQIVLSELHGRISTRIGECGDMEESTQLGQKLEAVMDNYNATCEYEGQFDA